MLVALTLAAVLSGCGKDSTPTGLAPLDQAPPAAPSQITSEVNAASADAVLVWTASPSANVAGYQVYQYSPSPDRESAYVLVAETDAATTRYGLPWTEERTTLCYRLRAVSATGVKSEWSAVVQVTVGPSAGPLVQPEEPTYPDRVPMWH
jgi:hypothetical protein